jgi:RHS repeat-associated protein
MHRSPVSRALASVLAITMVLPAQAAVRVGREGSEVGDRSVEEPAMPAKPGGDPQAPFDPWVEAEPLPPEAPPLAADPQVLDAPLPPAAPAAAGELVASAELVSKAAPAAALGSAAPKPATTAQAIPLPTAEGSLQGMGESFAPELGSGAATYSVPLAVPPGRAGVQPGLALSYSSAAGNGPAGLGWSLGVPFIARQSDRGLPRYVDRSTWHVEEDRFFYNGGQELVPVDVASIELADCGAPACAPIPAELAGWPQYRARIEGGFLRFFRSPDSTRWVVQSADGSRFDFGRLPVGDGPAEAVSRSASALHSEGAVGQGRVYRWLLTRWSDSHGSGIYYLYDEHDGQRYLADVYYTSPHAACGALASAGARRRCAAPLDDYGRRIRLIYESRPDVLTSFTSGWQVRTARRLRRIEMTSAEAAPGFRTLVRRYHLGYDPGSFWSLLASVELEGRPSRRDPFTGAIVGITDVPEDGLGEARVGQRRAPIRFEYGHQPVSGLLAPGFGGADPTVHAAPTSPAHSVGENADLFDVNSDGLPDLVVTDPARFRTSDGGPAVGVYWNGFGAGQSEPGVAGGFSAPGVMPMRADLNQVLRLTNANLSPLDVDGDGRSDFLHLPRTATGGYFTPVRVGAAAARSPAQQGWGWAYVERTLPANDPDPRIDFAHDGDRLRLFDVNNDHLVDIVRTTGAAMHVWLNLGWLPGGDGRYGSAAWNAGAARWDLSTAPIETCLPVAGTPLDFADPEVRLGDMNGDGLTDIVKVRKGSAIYWPGRGEGAFGIGPSLCPAGLATGRHVTMADAPTDLDPNLAGVKLADMNGDGVDDLIRVSTTDVDIWFNRAGAGFSGRIRLADTPFAPSFDDKVRLADVDGSGTVDIVYANANNWRWIDPMGGRRPRLLTAVDNGVGARTVLAYGSSTSDYLADLAEPAGPTWAGSDLGCDAKIQAATATCARRSGGSPVVSTVVRQVETSDQLDRLGLPASTTTTRFRYHDAFYEGIEQEFRGFGFAETIRVGDEHTPTAIERVHMHQGRRAAAIASDRLADNPDEALKGAVYLAESFDEAGRVLSSTHSTFTLRRITVGRSGIAVVQAYVSQTDQLVYDVGAWQPSSAAISVPAVIRPGGLREDHELRVRAAGWAHTRTSVDEIDGVGHALRSTAHGRIRGEYEEPVPDERIVTHATYVNVPGSTSGWLWRQATAFTDGHGDPTRLGEVENTLAATGDVVIARTRVTQGLLPRLDGDGEAEGFGAPQPEDLVASGTFDVWGNAVASCNGGDAVTSSACLRRERANYDADYASTLISAEVATRPGAGGLAWLATQATWDRGLAIPREIVTARGERTRVLYDGLGRVTAIQEPNVVGCTGSWPTARVDYDDPIDPGQRPISVRRITSFNSCGDGDRSEQAFSYVDGLGRDRAALATGADAESAPWIRTGLVELDRRGAARAEHQGQPFVGDPHDLGAVLARPHLVPRIQSRRDAFGRVVQATAEDGSLTRTVYHALSTDVYDSLDLSSGAFHGTPVTTRTDGHRRPIDQVLRNRQPNEGAIEVYRLFTTYRTDGAVLTLTRAQTATDAPRPLTSVVAGRSVERRFFYDSVRRRVASTDPDTDDRQTAATWRYLFNRVGDLVALRDPRGCGRNLYYDLAGRAIGEAYVGCAEAQQSEAPVATLPFAISRGPTGPVAVDALAVYDDLGASWAGDAANFEDYPAAASPNLGRLVATLDRGQRRAFAYDGRGHVIWEARQLALIPEVATDETLVDRAVVFDEAHTYERTTAFDHGGRVRSLVLPRDPDFDQGGAGPRVVGTMIYDRRGMPFSSAVHFVEGGGALAVTDGVVAVSGATVTSQTVVAQMEYTHDGLPWRTTFGDDLGGGRRPTVTTSEYDIRRRVVEMRTERAATVPPAPLGADRPLGAVTVVHHQRLTWDQASNLVSVDDLRLAEEWPAGHRPQFRRIQHDALYRVTGVEYEYAHDLGGMSAHDDATDWRAEQARTHAVDPMRRRPAEMVALPPPDRVVSQTWALDWLGNVNHWGDDAHLFFERSIGAIHNGADLSAEARPSALYLAVDLAGPTLDRGGWLSVSYGAGGNVVGLEVNARCVDAGAEACADPGGPLAARVAALRATCSCAASQRFEYRWDELNRLVEARRFDGAGTVAAVRQRYRYDSDDLRTVKQTLDPSDGESIALYGFAGDFERRGLERGAAAYRVRADGSSDTEYVAGGARVVWHAGAAAAGLDPDHRVSVAVPDYLGSASAVIDLRTGELTQVGTYYPNGGRETLLGAAEPVPFEPIGFTGKEDDQEVALVYFGQRYLIPGIGRWASPDPLAIHAVGGGEPLNAYQYVAGNLLQARDPLGLDDEIIASSTRYGSFDLNQQYWEDELSTGEQAVEAGVEYQMESIADQGWRILYGDDGKPIIDRAEGFDGDKLGEGSYRFSILLGRGHERKWLRSYGDTGLATIPEEPGWLERAGDWAWEKTGEVLDACAIVDRRCALAAAGHKALGGDPTGAVVDLAVDKAIDKVAGDVLGGGKKAGKKARKGRSGRGSGADDVDPAFKNGWTMKSGIDADWRKSGKTWRDAKAEAFRRTGVDKDKFKITKWAQSTDGKSFPVEWRGPQGAEVSIDFGHKNNGPGVPHVGWQKPGKKADVGHILLDDVPFGR